MPQITPRLPKDVIFKVIPLVTIIFSSTIASFLSNHMCRFIKLRLEGEYDLAVAYEGLFKGQVDGDSVYETCQIYKNEQFDTKWHTARAFAVISDILSLCALILAMDTLRLEYDNERRYLIFFTCLEVGFSKGMTLLLIRSNACNGIYLPEEYRVSRCTASHGMYMAIFNVAFWALASIFALLLPPPNDDFEVAMFALS